MGTGDDSFISTLVFDAADGDPSAGSAQLSTPFDYTGNGLYDMLQKVHVAQSFEEPVDMSGKTMTAVVKLTTDGSADPTECPMLAKPFAKSGDLYVWADNDPSLLALDTWVEVSFTPGGDMVDFDETDVRLVGVEITPNPSTDCVTGDTVVLIDSITIK